MSQQQQHSKSVSPTKEVIWRRPPQGTGFVTNQRRPFTTTFVDDDAGAGSKDGGEMLSCNQRRSFFQSQRQHSALQSFHHEQAQMLRNRKWVSFYFNF